MMRRIHPGLLTIGGAIVILAALVALLAWDRSAPPAEKLVIYCAPAVKAPLEELAVEYEKEVGPRIEFRFGPSENLLAQISVQNQSKAGDLFLPADDSYIAVAQKKGLVDEILSVARMRPVVLVHPSCPRTIAAWADLLSPGVNLAQAEPEAAAIGKLVKSALTKTGKWDELKPRTKVFTGTVVEAANAAKLGTSIHACIAWDAMASLYPELKVVRLPELDGIVSHVKIAVLKSTEHPAEALRFARFLTARDRGVKVLEKFGYHPAERGDRWDLRPTITVYGGSMLRPAVEATIKEFQDREGVDINTHYDGCGNLVGRMKTKAWPDLYFACDPRFLKMVEERFDPPVIVSQNRLVIAVPKGNPHKIGNLKDLGQEGVKVGVGHEQQCALGTITKETFLAVGVYARVRKNVKVESPSGDLLINQLRAKGLDAVVAYQSNVTPFDDIEGIRVVGEVDCAPLQPVAVRKDTDHPQLTYRLFRALMAPASKQRFEKLGFTWEVK